MAQVVHAGEQEREFFKRELESFVPQSVFDAHTQLWYAAHEPRLKLADDTDEIVDIAVYRRWMAELLPGREIAGGMFWTCAVGVRGDDIRLENEMVAREVAAAPGSAGAMLISPTMDPDYVRQEVRRLGLTGLKCYHLQSSHVPTWEAEIPEYLPERLVQVADEEGLWITLHMVRDRAVADPSNLYWIRRYCEKYPRMHLNLAHAARGFNPYHTIEGLPKLRGLSNIWCDMSAVTDVGACEAIMEILGPDRLLYGSDFPVSHIRGRCVAIGDGFLWLYEDTLDWSATKPLLLQPVHVGLELLRMLKQAAWHLHLSDRQVEDLFGNNARRMVGLL